MKVCATCKNHLPLDFFHRHSSRKDGLQGRCKECRSIYARENPEVGRNAAKKWAENNREKQREIRNRRRRENRRAVKSDELYTKFRIRIDDYERMLSDQDGVCAICKQSETQTLNGAVKSLAVDHCHASGRVRGLLCGHCNTALGKVKDDPEILRSMIEYLASHAEVGGA